MTTHTQSPTLKFALSALRLYREYVAYVPRVGLILISCSITSCALLSSAVQKQIERKFDLPTSNEPFFQSCLVAEEGSCSIDKAIRQQPLNTSIDFEYSEFDEDGESVGQSFGALLAAELLSSDIQGSLNSVISRQDLPLASEELDEGELPMLIGPEPTVDILLDEPKILKYQELLEQVTLLDGWGGLLDEMERFDESEESVDIVRFIEAYIKDYFRSGKVLQLSVTGEELAKGWTARLKDIIPGLPTESSYENIVKDLLVEAGLNKDLTYSWGGLSDSGFVTRGGVKYQFPALRYSFDLADRNVESTKVDFSVVGSDLIRVLIHAVGDAHNRLPALAGSSGLAVDGASLTPFDPKIHMLSNEQFAIVETRSSQVEGVVGAGVGRLLRGASVLALNNESLAQLIETSIAVASRKKSEKIFWCYQACIAAAEELDMDDALNFKLNDVTSMLVKYND